MKERPILFSGPMVRAILDGSKTMTRRVVKPQPLHIAWFDHQQEFCAKVAPLLHKLMPCPFGKPGDRLWVRETWKPLRCEHEPGHFVKNGCHDCQNCRNSWAYRASDPFRDQHVDWNPWKSPLFMKREASRITLEIVSVKVERLQDISEDDAFAEGVQAPRTGRTEHGEPAEAVYEFMRLWDSINGKKHPWESNPWVWVVEFEVVQ